MVRDTERWRKTMTVGRKRGERDVPVGSWASKKQAADWLDSFYSLAAAPICFYCYCTGVFVQLCGKCLCLRDGECKGDKCLCV